MAIRILIADSNSGHAATCLAAINSGYGSDITANIQVVSSLATAISQASGDSNIVAILRSYAGVATDKTLFTPLYPECLGFYPLGSNNFELLTVLSEDEPPIVVTSGAGDAEAKNNTGYGKGLEFWDDDLDVSAAPDLSSYSNGYILGKLLKIKDSLACTWFEARYRARATALQTESNRLNAGWDIYNGYGKIDVSKAIAYKGVIPPDPYLYTTEYITGLEDDVLELTAENAVLTTDNNLLTAQVATLIFTENVKGFTISKVTDFGTLTAGKIYDVVIEDNLVKCKVDYYIDSSDLLLEPVLSEEISFYERDIIDFIYKHFCINQTINNNALIT